MRMRMYAYLAGGSPIPLLPTPTLRANGPSQDRRRHGVHAHDERSTSWRVQQRDVPGDRPPRGAEHRDFIRPPWIRTYICYVCYIDTCEPGLCTAGPSRSALRMYAEYICRVPRIAELLRLRAPPPTPPHPPTKKKKHVYLPRSGRMNGWIGWMDADDWTGLVLALSETADGTTVHYIGM